MAKPLSPAVAEAVRRAAAASERGEPGLVLVGHPAFRSLRNLWMLEELGVSYEHVPAKPASRDARAVNPFGKVPTLLDGPLTMQVPPP